ncbi:acyltransferase family protein [Streptosporangium sp. NPDC000396]|uniref:acyltransferase family protein n=1 Tax=Streptosporangium sp. NPDC000396 TaxID=3366185 RepID=UPI00368A1D38
MSDPRPPFQVPTPRDNGAPDAGTGRSADGQGRAPAPWPMPEYAKASPPDQASWPEPPDQRPATSTWRTQRDGQGSDEDPGEVTAWGYQAYQEPQPPAAQEARAPHWNTQPPTAQEARAPHWNDTQEARASGRYDTQPPAAGNPTSRWDTQPSLPRETRTPYPDARPSAPGSPLDAAPAGAPAARRLDPLDPAWSPETGAPHASARPPAWAPATPLRQPQETRTASEHEFSYWENSSRAPESPYWSQFSDPVQEQQPDEPPTPPGRKKRDPYLDNAKFVLIALVVAGHSLVPTLAAHSAKSAYLFIYTFHMPAFVLISGYLGRNFWNSNAKINKLVDTMLVPYVVVEIGYALLRFGLGQKWTLTIIDPAWLNWYLLALVLWRISTPIWTRMRQPLVVAVIICLVAGFSEISGDFSLDRFFGLLPFYVLGLLLKPEHFDLLKPLWVKIVSGITMIAAVGVAIFVAPRIGLDPVYFRYSFKSMDMTWWVGLGVRAAMLVAALVLSVALLALIPRRETWFSDLGTRTLYAYLLHGVVVVIAKDQGWLSFPWLYGPLGVLAIMSSSVVLAIVLCLPTTRTLFKWLLEPRLVWLYRRPAEGPARRESSAAVPR